MERGLTPARMIEVISPAGFERFFRELSDLTAVGAPESRRLAAWRSDTSCRSRSPTGCPT